MVACASQQFDAVDGVLHLGYSAMSRKVAEVGSGSVGDGEFGQLTSTGKLMTDMRLHWKSTYKAPVNVQIQLTRARRTMQIMSGNFAYIRERFTGVVGIDSGTPILAPDPTTDPLWDSEFGGGIGGDGSVGYRTSTPLSSCILFTALVPVGQSIDVRFRATIFTQLPWGGATPNSAYGYTTYLSAVAYPENI